MSVLKYKDPTTGTWVAVGMSSGGSSYTDEQVRDVVAAFITAGANVTVTHNDTGNTLTIAATASGGGGGITTEDAVDAVAAALVAGNNIDIAYNDASNTITIDVEALTKSDVGLANVDNTADSAKPVSTAQAAADALKADKTTAIATTAPLTGGGDLSANRTLAITSFAGSAAGAVPTSVGGTANFLRADGTWALPPGSGAGAGHASFVYNATTTAPPADTNIRMNATQLSATTIWVDKNDFDGLDVSIGLAKILAGYQLYIQDYDDASKWVKYAVTANAVDSGNYFTIAVAYHSGPGGAPTGSGAAGRIELQPIAPGTVGVPPGGATGQILGKIGSADYAVGWVADQVGAGGGIDAEAAVDAVAAAMAAPSGGITVTYNDAANTLTLGTSAIPAANVSGLSGLATATTLAAVNTAITDADVVAGLGGSSICTGVWIGTAAQYAAIGTKVSTVAYLVTA